jgi:SAM-dependent methyltransferase
MSDEIRDAYEEVPYDTRPQPHTHPAHLAALAARHGIETAAFSRCRVLELGCGNGGNLLAMALQLPGSTFVGVDLVAPPCAIPNVELRAMSIMDVDAGFGPFDFIICHGVFSWVPVEVQQKIFAICRGNLAPNGIAYISYNTFPGWHFRGAVRDLVRFHTRDGGSALERTEKALRLIRFMTDGAENLDHWYAKYLLTMRNVLEEIASPSYFVHEYLAPTNEPLYFRDFIARAARHQLRYVCEADVDATESIAERFREFTNDRVELEQYVDFLIGRVFRRTLLTIGVAAATPIS